jgi:phosphomannomutase
MEGANGVAGFEANGGFLLGTGLPGLAALPTRDAVLPMLAILTDIIREGAALADIVAGLPPRFTSSDRLQNIPPAASRAILSHMVDDAAYRDSVFRSPSFPGEGALTGLDTTDGVRMTFTDRSIVHLRASGNAPELRCYAEAESSARARELCRSTLQILSARFPSR